MSSFHELTPKLIRQFCIDDKHSTFAGKAGYLNVTKQFIYYLEINNLVSSKNLSLCITAGTASSEKIVDILTEEQIQIIERFPAKANTKVQLRDAAMVMLSLKKGLRASDVIHLCFENIDWQNQTITIVQYKTKVELTLPMPTSVGNAIYSYLKYGRPVCSGNYVFVRHRAPYGPLTGKLCTNALHRIVPERKMVKGGGFHVTRRTFATGILRNGYGSNRVMDTLGHTDPTSVMKYLSMDEESMRKCPLSLNELTLSLLERGDHS